MDEGQILRDEDIKTTWSDGSKTHTMTADRDTTDPTDTDTTDTGDSDTTDAVDTDTKDAGGMEDAATDADGTDADSDMQDS